MGEELEALRDELGQLKAAYEYLRQERAESQAATSTAMPGSAKGPFDSEDGTGNVSRLTPVNVVTERLVYVPKERKCPVFRGKHGIGIIEWEEEARACMRARHLTTLDQAFFLYDHLEGEAKDEIKYRPREEKEDPEKIIEILQELYGCSQSYIALQENFFSRRQQEGETLQEFSLALMSLMEKVIKSAPNGMPNSDVLLRDQFIEYVNDSALRRELKQLVRRHPICTLLDVRAEAIRWEREGMPGGVRGRSYSVPSVCGLQCGAQGVLQSRSDNSRELAELKDILKKQQEQLDLLTQSLARLQNPQPKSRFSRNGPVICNRCQKPGHFARDCDGDRVLPTTLPSSSQSQASRPHASSQLSGN